MRFFRKEECKRESEFIAEGIGLTFETEKSMNKESSFMDVDGTWML